MKNNENNKSYFELTEHSTIQVTIFSVIFITSFIIAFHVALPFIEYVVVNSLKGRVFNAGELVDFALSENQGKDTQPTGYYTHWAIDIYLGTNQESRYWFVPLISMLFPLSIVSLIFSVLITAILPRKIGYIRQKIEREISKSLDRIAIIKDGFYYDGQLDEIAQLIKNSDVRELHSFQQQWHLTNEDIKTIKSAIEWQTGSLFYKITRIANGLNIYMRFYFTEKYSNTMLGLVYIGAAVLIIIIGMRGLKFIPSTQPSFVFFALGLEFSLLLTYALTLIFARQEESTIEMPSESRGSGVFLSNDFGNSKEVENLLRVFIKTGRNKSKD